MSFAHLVPKDTSGNAIDDGDPSMLTYSDQVGEDSEVPLPDMDQTMVVLGAQLDAGPEPAGST